MDSSPSYLTRPPLLTNIHAFFNQRSVIYTTTLMPLAGRQLFTGISTIARLDGSYGDILTSSPRECVICSSKIDFYDLIAAVNDSCDLICYSCLQEAKKVFICDRLMLLKELINLAELREDIISSLQCVIPKEKFTLSSGATFTRYCNETRISYMNQLELIYNDLTRLQMKLPFWTFETSAHVTFRWSHCSKEYHVIELLLPLKNGDLIVTHHTECPGELVCERSYDDKHPNLNDALIRVKVLINV
jgi:hypothetical protein